MSAPIAPNSRSSRSPIGGETLIAAITTFLADRDAQTLAAIRDALATEITAAGPDALALLGATAG